MTEERERIHAVERPSADVIRLAAKRREAVTSKSGFCFTPTATWIVDTLEHCHSQGEMRWIVGAPGIGKTTAINHYSAYKRDVHVVTASPLDEDYKRFLRTLGESVDGLYGVFNLAENIRHKLSDSGKSDSGSHLIIVDEVQHLSPKGFEMLRYFHDVTSCGVVLSGNPIAISRFKGKRRQGYEALLSRLGAPIVISGLIPEDIEAICEHHAISGARACSTIERIAMEPGGLRDVARIVAIVRREIGPKKPIELQHITAAMEFLGLS